MMNLQSNTVVGIAHYNTPSLLIKCIASLGGEAPVVVFDDGSESPSPMAKQHEGGIHCGVHPTFNALFSACMEVKPQWLCFLGSDTQMLKPNWVNRWQQGIEILEQRQHIKVGMAAAMIVDETGHILFGGANEGLDCALYGAHKFYGALPNYASSQMTVQPWLTGTALMIRAEALADVAEARLVKGSHGIYFDEDYQIFCGDRELGYQMRSCGWSLGYIPAVQVLHDHGGSQSVNKLPMNREEILQHDEAILHSRWKGMIESWKA